RSAPRGKGDEAAVARQGRPHLGVGRAIQARVFDQLLFFPIPEVDLPGTVFSLEGESTVSAVVRQGRVALGGGAGRRAGLAKDLPAANPVVFVEENIGVFGTVAVRGKSDEKL